MRLSDLVKSISTMSTEELLAHVDKIRRNKYIDKPAKEKHEADAEKKSTRKKMSTVDKLINGMSDEDRAALLKSLGIGDE